MTDLGNLDEYQIVFPKLGIDIKVNDTAFTVFGMDIKWYGILITLGMLLAMIYGFSHMKKFGLNPDRAIDAVIGGIIGGIVGARLYYVLMKWEDYSGDLKNIFNIRNGGLAIYGGIIGAFIVGGIVAKIRKVKLMPMLDIAGIGFLIGQGVGRWGNFTNHEAFGYNTDSLFGMSSGKIQSWIINNYSSMSSGSDIIAMDPNKPVHPCFLYESIWCLLGFVILALVARKFRKYDGQIFLMYIGWYGFGRFFIEGLRTDSLMLGNLRVSQVVAGICFIVSVILQIIIYNKVKRDGYVLYCDTEESKMLMQSTNTSQKSENENEDSEISDDENREEEIESETSDEMEEEDNVESNNMEEE